MTLPDGTPPFPGSPPTPPPPSPPPFAGVLLDMASHALPALLLVAAIDYTAWAGVVDLT